MPPGIFSTRSISTAAFYTACSAHPRCWSKGHIEKSLALEPFWPFLSEVGRLMHFSLLLPPILLSAPRVLIKSIRQGQVKGALLPIMVRRLAAPPSPAPAQKCQWNALDPPQRFQLCSREVTAIILQKTAGRCLVLLLLRGQCWY